MSEVLVSRFEDSNSFNDAKKNIKLLEEVQYWSKNYSERIAKAGESNSQISGSWGVFERVTALINRWTEKGV